MNNYSFEFLKSALGRIRYKVERRSVNQIRARRGKRTANEDRGHRYERATPTFSEGAGDGNKRVNWGQEYAGCTPDGE